MYNPIKEIKQLLCSRHCAKPQKLPNGWLMSLPHEELRNIFVGFHSSELLLARALISYIIELVHCAKARKITEIELLIFPFKPIFLLVLSVLGDILPPNWPTWLSAFLLSLWNTRICFPLYLTHWGTTSSQKIPFFFLS